MKKKLALLVLTLALLVAAFVQMQNGRADEKQGDGSRVPRTTEATDYAAEIMVHVMTIGGAMRR